MLLSRMRRILANYALIFFQCDLVIVERHLAKVE